MSDSDLTLRRLKDVLAHCGSNLAVELETELAATATRPACSLRELSFAFRRAMGDVLMDEFLAAGLTEEREENDYGRELEMLINKLELNRRF